MLLLLACLLLASAEDVAVPPSGVPTAEERASSDGVGALRAADLTPEQWIDAVDAQAGSLPGMRYSVQRRSELATGQQVEERWRIVQYGSSFRIDYFGDTARQITFDGRSLVDYVPANRQALRFHVDRMATADAQALLGQILSKVAVPGFRLGQAEQVTWRITDEQTVGDRPVVVLEGDGREATHLRYVIDRERIAVLSTEITQNGQVLLRADSRDLREVRPGVWLPHEVEMHAPDQGGQVRVILHLTKVAVLTDSPVDLFDARLDASISVEEKP